MRGAFERISQSSTMLSGVKTISHNKNKTNDTALSAIHGEPAFPREIIAFFRSRSFSFPGAFDVSWEKYIDRGCGAGVIVRSATLRAVTRSSLLGNATANSKKFITFLSRQ